MFLFSSSFYFSVLEDGEVYVVLLVEVRIVPLSIDVNISRFLRFSSPESQGGRAGVEVRVLETVHYCNH